MACWIDDTTASVRTLTLTLTVRSRLMETEGLIFIAILKRYSSSSYVRAHAAHTAYRKIMHTWSSVLFTASVRYRTHSSIVVNLHLCEGAPQCLQFVCLIILSICKNLSYIILLLSRYLHILRSIYYIWCSIHIYCAVFIIFCAVFIIFCAVFIYIAQYWHICISCAAFIIFSAVFLYLVQYLQILHSIYYILCSIYMSCVVFIHVYSAQYLLYSSQY